MDASKRGSLLYKVADLIERDLDYLAVSEIMLEFIIINIDFKTCNILVVQRRFEILNVMLN